MTYTIIDDIATAVAHPPVWRVFTPRKKPNCAFWCGETEDNEAGEKQTGGKAERATVARPDRRNAAVAPGTS